jgi:hypothetical protein
MVGQGSFDLQFTKVYFSSRGSVTSPCHFLVVRYLLYCVQSSVSRNRFSVAVVWYACRGLVERYVLSVSVVFDNSPTGRH